MTTTINIDNTSLYNQRRDKYGRVRNDYIEDWFASIVHITNIQLRQYFSVFTTQITMETRPTARIIIKEFTDFYGSIMVIDSADCTVINRGE